MLFKKQSAQEHNKAEERKSLTGQYFFSLAAKKPLSKWNWLIYSYHLFTSGPSVAAGTKRGANCPSGARVGLFPALQGLKIGRAGSGQFPASGYGCRLVRIIRFDLWRPFRSSADDRLRRPPGLRN